MKPVLSAAGERTLGRSYEFATRTDFAWRLDGSYGKVVDFTYSSNEGRELIRTAARDLGWRERMPLSARIGLVFGVIGGIGAIITVVVLAVLALLGKF